MALAFRRWSPDTASIPTPNTSAAVALCTSKPSAKAVSRPASLRKVSHDAQLNLRVVRRHNLVPRRGDKGLSYPTALLRPDRNILQIGIRG